MADVRLVDLDVIKRYSLVVRRDAVPADELLAALEASKRTVLLAIEQDGRAANASATKRPSTKRATTKAPSVARRTKAAGAQRAPAPPATTTRSPAKRAATKRAATAKPGAAR
jgi:hypothetical protein